MSQLKIYLFSNLNLFSVRQERNYNFVTKIIETCDYLSKSFLNKQQEINKVMTTVRVDQFCDYYKNHSTKQVIYFRDRYGDSRQPNMKNSMSFNNQAIEQFKTKG